MTTSSPTYRRRRPAMLLTLLAVLAGAAPAGAQNAAIESWSPPGQIRSTDVRLRDASAVMADYFDSAVPEQWSLIKSQNAIYARFGNSSATIIPQASVTVTAEYAEADSAIAPANLAAEAAAVAPGDWHAYGSYVMNLEILPADPPGFGLLPGSYYPTVREVGFPSRYRIACSVDCAQPLPTSFFLRATLTTTFADSNSTDDVALAYYDLAAGVPPSDVVILHDVSGSMSGQLAAAQQRAKMFVDLLNAGDRIGVVAFSTQFAGGASQEYSLHPIATSDPSDVAKTNAKLAIDGFSASGATPMGAGVLEAQSTLHAGGAPFPANRAIVMLTDGMENQNPRLDDPVGPPPYPIFNDPAPPPTGLDFDPDGPIALYPLWFGPVSNWGLLLLQTIITEVDSGKVVDQPADDLALAEAYLMIRGILVSDDIYAIHRGETGDGYEGSIFVDTVTRELILALAWQSFDRDLDVAVQPPGAAGWQAAAPLAHSVARDGLYVVYRFTAPATGQWRYRVAAGPQFTDGQEMLVAEHDLVVATHARFAATGREASGRGREPYVLSALADQVEVLLQSSVADSSVAAGEPLVIEARLSRAGQPVAGATVRAAIRVPDAALGTLLAQHRGQLQTPPQTGLAPDQTRAAGIARELGELLGNDRLFSYGDATVTLTDDDGDGTYTGRFDDTRVAGTYAITITAEGAASSAGDTFRREHRHSAVVSLGAIDPGRSTVRFDRLDRVGPEGESFWQVVVVPVDVHGNYLSPSYASRIEVEATSGRWLGALVDHEDGTYSRTLMLDRGAASRITVTAFGDTVVRDRALTPGAATGGPYQFSLHAGTAIPSGGADRVLDPGAAFVLDFGYRLGHRLTVLGLAGFYDLPRTGAGSETVLELSANLRRRLTGGVLAPYVQGGPGAYRAFGGWELGGNLGLGLTYSASPATDLEGGVDYHDVFSSGDDDLQFWTVHAGFAIRF